jgi:hypothetical protein|nr:MAG TPA: Helix-turn-helix XRE-family like protein [Bacteriophage sp.]
MKTVDVIIERGSDGTFDANMETYSDLEFGLLGQGKTVEEAKADLMNSYNEIKEIFAEQGKEVEDLRFEFKYDIPSFLQYYAFAFTLAGVERITGVSQGQLSHYINGVRKPSEKTARKIQERIHEFAKNLSQVRFV